MLTFDEVVNREGYYHDARTGDVLRVVGPGETCCWRDGSWHDGAPPAARDEPRFTPVTRDVLARFDDVLRAVEQTCGTEALSGRIVNRQSARQPTGGVATQETVMRTEKEHPNDSSDDTR